MAILQEWQKIAYNEKANQGELQRFWQRYFLLEKGVYEQLLTNPDEKVEGTVKELAEKYNLSVMEMTGFLDGINDSLVEANPIDTMEEDTKVNLVFDKEKLYKNMVDAKADWLYELPQWDNLLDEETRISKEAEYNALINDYSNEIKLLNEQYNSVSRQFAQSRQELDELLKKHNLEIADVEKVKYDREEKNELDERISSGNMQIQLYNEKLNKVNMEIAKKQSDMEHAYNDLYRICEKKEPVSKKKITNTNFKDRIILIQNEIRDNKSDLEGVLNLFAGYRNNLTALAEYSELKAEVTERGITKSDFVGKSVKEIDTFRGIMIRDYKEILENERKQSAVITRLLNDMARKNIFRDEFFQKSIEVLMSITDNAVNFLKQLDIFVSSYEGIIEKLEVDVAMVEKESARIVELLEEYVRDVHEDLGRIDGNSTIKVHGKDKKMLKITIPEWYSNEEMYHLKVKDILDEVTAKTVMALENNENPEEVISLYINTKYLYDSVIGTGNVRIRLYKIEEQKGREISWSDVAKNSGGEGFLSAFIVLSSLLYYMRKDVSDVFTNYNEGKVLVMDNPFAQTNASHLLKPLMDMAKKTNTQLICLSGLGGDSIYDRFDNIYVLNLVAASLRNGMQYLKGEHTRGEESDTMIATQIQVTQQELMF